MAKTEIGCCIQRWLTEEDTALVMLITNKFTTKVLERARERGEYVGEFDIQVFGLHTTISLDRSGKLKWMNVELVISDTRGLVTYDDLKGLAEVLATATGDNWHVSQEPETDEEDEQMLGMFSLEGGAMLNDLLEKELAPGNRAYWGSILRAGMKRIAGAGHGEVYDTAVREVITAQVKRKIEEHHSPTYWGGFDGDFLD